MAACTGIVDLMPFFLTTSYVDPPRTPSHESSLWSRRTALAVAIVGRSDSILNAG
jgi:hypothetical protein